MANGSQNRTACNARKRLPNLNSLKAFEAAARYASIKCAAQELCVTPAAVSQQIRKLEDEVSAPLFVREHRHIKLTPAGVKLSQSLQAAFCEIHSTLEGIRVPDLEQEVKVISQPSLAAKFVGPRLCEFFTQQRNINVVVEAATDNLHFEQQLRSGDADIGIFASVTDIPDMRSNVSFWEYHAPMATPNYLEQNAIKKPEDLANAVLIERNCRSIFPDAPLWKEWFQKASVSGWGEARCIDFGNNYDQAIDAAVAGSGVVLGGAILASSMLRQSSLVAPFGPSMPVNLALRVVSAKKAGTQRPAVKIVEEWLINELEEAEQLIAGIR